MKRWREYGADNVGPGHVKEAKKYILEELGLNIRKIRKQNNETLEDLANALNITKSTLSQYENGHIDISAAIITIIAARYKVSISELYGEEITTENFHQIDFFKAMISNSLINENDIFLDEIYYENILSNYFNKYLATDRSDSFDKYFAVSSLLEQIDNLHIYGLNGTDYEIMKNKIIDNFLHKIDKIRVNNYTKRSSVFMNDLITTLSDEKHRNMNDFPAYFNINNGVT